MGSSTQTRAVTPELAPVTVSTRTRPVPGSSAVGVPALPGAPALPVLPVLRDGPPVGPAAESGWIVPVTVPVPSRSDHESYSARLSLMSTPAIRTALS